MPRIRNIEDDLKQLAKLKEESELTLKNITDNEQQSRKLLAYITTGAIEGHYAKQAVKDDKTAWWFLIGTILLIGATIGWLLQVIYIDEIKIGALVMDKYTFLRYFLPRGSITVCILGFATYLGKQFIYYRTRSDYFRNKEFALQTISPYIEDIAKEETTHALKEKLVNVKSLVIEQVIKDIGR